MISTLVLAPQTEETKALLEGLYLNGYSGETKEVGSIQSTIIPSLGMMVAVGGHGKAQFALQAQHLIEHLPDLNYLFCVGGAGQLSGTLNAGDIVVGSTTIEHDYKLRFTREPLPRHDPDATLLLEFQKLIQSEDFPFETEIGPIASGDEDIVDAERRHEIKTLTGALCVAWEGSGGARTARFNNLPFLEIRAITDRADTRAGTTFHENIDHVMPNIAELLIRWHATRQRG